MAHTDRVNVLATAEVAAEFAAARFADAVRAAISSRGRFVAALAGGTTPRLMYRALASAPHKTQIDWPRVTLLWSDERCVPPDHPASNYGMAREALLSHVSIDEANVHRIRGEDEPVAAADAYERELRKLFGAADGPPPSMPGRRIDFALLGLGDDGHTASLFPGATHDDECWVETATAPAEPKQRITLTPLVINAAAEIMFLVTGNGKADILRRVLEGPRLPAELPAQLVAPTDGTVRWVVDAGAVHHLKR